MMNVKFLNTAFAALGLLFSFSLSAQDNWQHTENDRKVAVEVDSITKGGYTLIWINKDKDLIRR